VEGLASLGASLRSSFKFGTAYNIGKIEEGYERPTSSNHLGVSVLGAEVKPTREYTAGTGVPLEPCVARPVAVDVAVAELDDASALEFKPKAKPKSRSFLGSFLLALTVGRSGEAPAAPPVSRQGSAASASLLGWMSSKKVLPAQ
jgi:hypothetical protein